MTATQSFADGVTLYLATKLTPGGVVTVTTDPGVTNGRLYYKNNFQVEWLEFTSVTPSGSYFILGGVTRDIDPTTIPITSNSTGKTWLATQSCVLVLMHDQIVNANVAQQIHQEALIFATKTARDTELGANGVCTFNYTDIKCTDTGLFYNYNTSTGQWEVQGTGTATPNASTTVSGSVEIATQAEFDAGTNTGGTGAKLVTTPDLILKQINTATEKTTMIGNDLFGIADSADSGKIKKLTLTNFENQLSINGFSMGNFGGGIDGNVIINSGTTTLTRDMYYNNLTITSPGVLNPNGYRIYVKGTLDGNGTIIHSGNNGGIGGNGNSGNGIGGSGGTGGVALNTGTLGAFVSGANGGGGGGGGVGAVGGTGTSVNPSYSNVNGSNGGVGGTGTSGGAGGALGAGGTSTRGALYNIYYTILQLLHPASYGAITFGGTVYKTSAGGGGGGGGGTPGVTNAAGGGGGGGGGNGGMIWISAYIINFSGALSVLGGNGGNGGIGNTTGFSAGGGGGGGGGNGGIIYLISSLFTSIGTQILTGGTGGTGGLGSGGGGGGSNGANGINGGVGQLIQITI